MSRIHGSLDEVAAGWARGWAQDVAAPWERQPVQIVVDGTWSLETRADEFRQDLADVGLADGCLAFAVALPRYLRDGSPHRVEVFAGDDGTPLAGSPASLIWAPPITAAIFDDGAPWIDRAGADVEIERRRANGSLTSADADLLRRWREDGIVVLPQVIDSQLTDRLWSDIERAWRERLPVCINVAGLGERSLAELGDHASVPSSTYRIMNFHEFSEAGLEILLHPRMTTFLRLIFDARPVAMQSLAFEYGSEQRGHMDFAYVHTRNPAYLAAAWVACEDVSVDAGPLFYYVGSHRRIPKYQFEDGGVLSFGLGPHNTAFEDHLEAWASDLGLERRVYCPRKGDVLIWHSALLHGGSKRLDRALTRRSFVVHYSTEDVYPAAGRSHGPSLAVVERNGGVYYANAKRR